MPAMQCDKPIKNEAFVASHHATSGQNVLQWGRIASDVDRVLIILNWMFIVNPVYDISSRYMSTHVVE